MSPKFFVVPLPNSRYLWLSYKWGLSDHHGIRPSWVSRSSRVWGPPTFPLPFLAQESQEKDTAHRKCSQAGCSAIEALKKKHHENRKRCSPKSGHEEKSMSRWKDQKDFLALSPKCIISHKYVYIWDIYIQLYICPCSPRG